MKIVPSGLALIAVALSSCGPTRAAEVVKADYRGWKTSALRNGIVEVLAVPAAGGRIVQFKLGDAEFLWVNPQLAGKDPPPGGLGPGDKWLNYGGDKLWPAPQGWDNDRQWPGPPDPVLDGGPYRCDLLQGRGETVAVRLTSGQDHRSGIQFSRTIRIEEGSSHVAFDATMTNIDHNPRRWGIWSHTQLNAGRQGGKGYNPRLVAYCPMNPRSRFPKGYNVLFGPKDNPAFQPDAGGRMMRVRYCYRVGKIGLDSPAGWIATVNGENGAAFVQRFSFEPGHDYPDGSAVEFWLNGLGSFRASGKENVMKDDPVENPYVFESEMISPFASLRPGASFAWHTDWYACRVGGAWPVLDCTPTGLTCRRLTARREGNRLRLAGRFGVFVAGRAEAQLFDAGSVKYGKIDLGPVSPTGPLVVSIEAAAPPEAVAVKLVVRPARGKEPGEVAAAAIAR